MDHKVCRITSNRGMPMILIMAGPEYNQEITAGSVISFDSGRGRIWAVR